jgi:alkylation response protein AidB-like acyl-CoA dehydrogenase
MERFMFHAEMAAADAPAVIPMGPMLVAPVLMRFGTSEQKDRHLPGIRDGSIQWCQGYSEPGSGSDLASLQTKCEDKGDHFLVNGSKIWTTLAQFADWIFCLVRSDNSGKPQEGITVDPIIMVDNPQPGMQEVNQVFFENVEVPKENLIGEVGKGWTYAKYLLEFERGHAFSPKLRAGLKKLRKMAATENLLNGDGGFARRLAALETAVMAMEGVELRILSRLANGQNPGAESSMLKCRGTELTQQVTELAVEAAGLYALPFRHYAPGGNEAPIGPGYEAVMPRYGNTRKVSIYGGTNEIQRNIMAKAILGL